MTSKAQITEVVCNSVSFMARTVSVAINAFVNIRRRRRDSESEVPPHPSPEPIVPGTSQDPDPVKRGRWFGLYEPLCRDLYLEQRRDVHTYIGQFIFNYISEYECPFDTRQMAIQIDRFGLIPGLRPTAKVIELIESRNNRHITLINFVWAILVETINPESDGQVSLLDPDLVRIYRRCRTPAMLEYDYYEQQHADLREILGKMIPPPDTRLLCEKLWGQLLALMRPLSHLENLDDRFAPYVQQVKLRLKTGIELVAGLGNALLVERTSWRWDWEIEGEDIDKVLVITPGFQMVRDHNGMPRVDNRTVEEVEKASYEIRRAPVEKFKIIDLSLPYVLGLRPHSSDEEN